MANGKPANTQDAGIKRSKNGRWKKGTKSPNPNGRPPLGESWREIFDHAGKLTKRELVDLYPIYGKRLIGLPDDVSLRDAVALSALVTLACEPSPGLLSAIMERVDGKITQPLSVDWREDAKQNGIDPERVLEIVDAAIERGFSGGSGDAPDDEEGAEKLGAAL